MLNFFSPPLLGILKNKCLHVFPKNGLFFFLGTHLGNLAVKLPHYFEQEKEASRSVS